MLSGIQVYFSILPGIPQQPGLSHRPEGLVWSRPEPCHLIFFFSSFHPWRHLSLDLPSLPPPFSLPPPSFLSSLLRPSPSLVRGNNTHSGRPVQPTRPYCQEPTVIVRLLGGVLHSQGGMSQISLGGMLHPHGGMSQIFHMGCPRYPKS